MTTDSKPTNRELAAQAVLFQGNRDFDLLRAICHPDVELDFPYWPTGVKRLVGVDAMIDQMSVIKVFGTFKIEIVDIFDTGGDVVIVEGRSHGTYKSGRPDYRNHYLFALSFRDGKLTLWREFFNPLEAMKQNIGLVSPAKSPS